MPDKDFVVGQRVQQTLQGKTRTGVVKSVSPTQIAIDWGEGTSPAYYNPTEARSRFTDEPAPPTAPPGATTGSTGPLAFPTAGAGGADETDPEDELRTNLISRYSSGVIDLDTLVGVAGMVGDAFVGLGDTAERARLAKALLGGGAMDQFVATAQQALSDRRMSDAERQFQRDYKLSVLDPLEIRSADPMLDDRTHSDLRLAYIRLAAMATRVMNQYTTARTRTEGEEMALGVAFPETTPASVTNFLSANLRSIFMQARPDIHLDDNRQQDVFDAFAQGVATVAQVRSAEDDVSSSFRGAWDSVTGALMNHAASGTPDRRNALMKVLSKLTSGQQQMERQFIPLGVAGQDADSFLNVALAPRLALALADTPEALAALPPGADLWTGLNALFVYKSAADLAREKAEALAAALPEAADVARQNEAQSIINAGISQSGAVTLANLYTPEEVAQADAEELRLRRGLDNLPVLALQNPQATAQQLAGIIAGGEGAGALGSPADIQARGQAAKAAADVAAQAGKVAGTADTVRQNQAANIINARIRQFAGWTVAGGYSPQQIAQAQAEVLRLQNAMDNLPNAALQNPGATAQQLADGAISGTTTPQAPGVTPSPAAAPASALAPAAPGVSPAPGAAQPLDPATPPANAARDAARVAQYNQLLATGVTGYPTYESFVAAIEKTAAEVAGASPAARTPEQLTEAEYASRDPAEQQMINERRRTAGLSPLYGFQYGVLGTPPSVALRPSDAAIGPAAAAARRLQEAGVPTDQQAGDIVVATARRAANPPTTAPVPPASEQRASDIAGAAAQRAAARAAALKKAQEDAAKKALVK